MIKRRAFRSAFSSRAFPDRASLRYRLITADFALRTTAVWSERRYLDLTAFSEPLGGRQGSLTEVRCEELQAHFYTQLGT